MRTTAVLSTVLLGATLVAGCGSGGRSDAGSTPAGYCQDLKAAKAQVASLNSSTPDFTKLNEAITTLHKLAAEAPPAVSEDWRTLDDAFAGLEADLAAAGLSLKDLGPLSKGQLPPGMTPAQLEALGPKLKATFAKLDGAKFQAATTAIEKHAKSTCHVDLGKG